MMCGPKSWRPLLSTETWDRPVSVSHVVLHVSDCWKSPQPFGNCNNLSKWLCSPLFFAPLERWIFLKCRPFCFNSPIKGTIRDNTRKTRVHFQYTVGAQQMVQGSRL